jgi:hypothetical protein
MPTVGPWETHPDAQAVESRQRYFGPDALGFNALPIPGVFPLGITVGNAFEVECFRTATLYLTVAAGGGSTVRVDLGLYDVDNVTLLTTAAIIAAGAVGVVTVQDFGAESPGTLKGRVFRVHDFRCSRTGAGGANPVVTLRCWWRT